MLRTAEPDVDAVAASPRNIQPALQLHPVYAQWIESGRPHNAICSQCRMPNDLLACASCCRSYHKACLSPVGVSAQSAPFQCPACCSGKWKWNSSHAQPSDNRSTPVSNMSHESHLSTPNIHRAAEGMRNPAEPIEARNFTQATPHGMQAPSTADHFVAPLDAFDPSILTMARGFLRSQGGFPEAQDFSPDFLLKLGSMMTELELHRERAQELVAENAQLRQDNANIRTYLDSNLATGRPSLPHGSDLSNIRPPSPDTTGKTWDRIVMDLI